MRKVRNPTGCVDPTRPTVFSSLGPLFSFLRWKTYKRFEVRGHVSSIFVASCREKMIELFVWLNSYKIVFFCFLFSFFFFLFFFFWLSFTNEGNSKKSRNFAPMKFHATVITGKFLFPAGKRFSGWKAWLTRFFASVSLTFQIQFCI